MEVDIEYRENDVLRNNAPAKGKEKAVKPPKAPKEPLATSAAQNAKDGRAIEEIYQKKTQLEHVLLRPDTYIGSTEKQQQVLWIHDGEKLVQKSIDFVPGLYKIFDEILVNAADNKVRDPTMDTLKVVIDTVNNSIQVWNNGDGIPVEIHKEEGVHVPELIFGHLLTSSNYNDDEKKVTGGRNGYGAKLANIFSTEFILETCDGKRQRRYKQFFRNNMTTIEPPKITACKASENWTSVTFKPDLAKFGMTHLEPDTVALMRRRVYDLAGVLGKSVKVYLNDLRLPIKQFQDYVDLYLGPKENGVPRIYERVNERWELCISPTDGQFQQVSFVNSIATTKGGTHVNYVVDQITKALVEKINKKNKNANVKPFMVKNHLWVFVNCQIENPAFDSQTKENLTLRASSFGSKCEMSTQLLDKIAKCGVVDHILAFAQFKNDKELKKSDGAKRSRLTGISKLDDANDAGGRNSQSCTLILTEGDSAKSLAVSGLSVVGRDHYGVFPLRGKLLNVREASAAAVAGNTEIQHIKQILGLQHGKQYEDVKQLRYGHLMIMTDQDHDGSHIKGLIMNFLHSFFPSLLRVPGFLVEFITPIVKVSKGKNKLTFYTMPEYEAWKESLGGITRGWTIKYYKGLGTSTKEEAKEYFARLDQHKKDFVWQGDMDGDAIEMAFSKKRVDDRKKWLSDFAPGTFLDQSGSEITYSDFINKELILFSRADLERSIPSMVDGLKPGQRKILFCCFKRNLKDDVKVGQLAGYVSEHSAYHHGEQSLQSTIVGLAQDFVGSNNIALLVPSGQFGTRLQGGKDAASARYIYTRLASLTRHLFNKDDDALLTYLNEEGQSIEPEWYVPIMPTVLINGAEGIGTGWSTSIPNYNPRDIVANLRRLMEGQPQETMHPWYRGFNGNITQVTSKNAARSYVCSGIVERSGDAEVRITELPVRKWTQDYKDWLETLVKPEDKADTPLLLDFKDRGNDSEVDFVLDVVPAKMPELVEAGLEAKLKLSTKFGTGNMMLFDKDGVIKNYTSPEHIIQEFYDLRLSYYDRRLARMLKDAEANLRCITNKTRFILAVIGGQLKINNRKKAEIEADLERQGFDKLPSGKSKAKAADAEEEDEDAAPDTGASYDYLLAMAISSLTAERVEALKKEAAQQEAVVEQLKRTSGKELWSNDLEAFLIALDEWEAEEQRRAEDLARKQKAAGRGKGKGKAAPARKKKSAMSSDEDDEDDDDDLISDDDDDFEIKVAKPKKPAAPRAAPAPRPTTSAALPSTSQTTASTAATAAAKGAVPVAVVPKVGAGRGRGRGAGKAAGAAPAAPGGPSISSSSAAIDVDTSSMSGPAVSGVTSLAARLNSKLNVSSIDDGEVSSPLVTKPAKARGGAAAAKGKAAAPVVNADAKKAAVKRKPKGKKAISSSEDEASDASAASDKDDDVYLIDAPSPAVAPKGKMAKTGPSPKVKNLGKTAAAAAPRAAAAAAPAVAAEADDAAPLNRPQRARKPAVSYIEISDSENSKGGSSGGDSDFSIEDDDD